jgi:hypothetical protein
LGSLITQQYECRTCEISFDTHEELEGHYVQSHLNMTNEPH